MAHAVESIDYAALVRRMAEVGMDGMGDVIGEELNKIGKPETRNEVAYFWIALFNACREEDSVWLWLLSQPHIRHYGPPDAGNWTTGRLIVEVPLQELPVIGGPDDGPFEPHKPKQWSAEATEDNFRQQAEALDAYLRAEGAKNPNNACKCMREYVDTWRYSGSGHLCASMQLTEGGYHALATQEGLAWLVNAYPAAA